MEEDTCSTSSPNILRLQYWTVTSHSPSASPSFPILSITRFHRARSCNMAVLRINSKEKIVAAKLPTTVYIVDVIIFCVIIWQVFNCCTSHTKSNDVTSSPTWNVSRNVPRCFIVSVQTLSSLMMYTCEQPAVTKTLTPARIVSKIETMNTSNTTTCIIKIIDQRHIVVSSYVDTHLQQHVKQLRMRSTKP